ncbi:hypothetical protein C0995_016337, partial [Termitomyces sp. Mi166
MAINIFTIAFFTRAYELTAFLVSLIGRFHELPQPDPLQFAPLFILPPPPPAFARTTPFLQATQTILIPPPTPSSLPRSMSTGPLECRSMVILAAVAIGLIPCVILSTMFIWHCVESLKLITLRVFLRTRSGAISFHSWISALAYCHLLPRWSSPSRISTGLLSLCKRLSKSFYVVLGPLKYDRMVMFAAAASGFVVGKFSELRRKAGSLKFERPPKRLWMMGLLLIICALTFKLWHHLPALDTIRSIAFSCIRTVLTKLLSFSPR